MVTSPDDSESTSLANHLPPQPCPRTTGISFPVELPQPQQQQQQQALAAQKMDAVMGLENFRFCSVLGRGHFGKVRHVTDFTMLTVGIWILNIQTNWKQTQLVWYSNGRFVSG